MDQDLITKIIEETDIVALASEFMSLTKKGKNYMGLCPFHDEKTPSFSVSPEKHIAKCMGCGMGGNTITFYSQVKNIPFEEAAIDLAQRLGLEVAKTKKVVDPNDRLYKLMEEASDFYQFALKNSQAGQEALDYLYKRDMSDEIINHFGIGLAPNKGDSLYQMLKSKSFSVSDMMLLGLVKQKETGEYYDVFRSRITFPIKNEKGRVVGFSARTLDKKEVVKYLNSTETPIFKKGELLYHYDESIRASVKQKSVILHEGFFDVIASYKANLTSVVATMGTALTNEQAQLIKRITNHVIIGYDGDKAGIKATLKAVPLLKNQNLKISILKLPNNLDPDDFVKKYGIEKYAKLFEERLIDPYQFGYEVFSQNKDFTKADDITQFKKEVTSLLKGVDQSVLAYYQKKANQDFGIDLYLTNKIAELPPKKQQEIKPALTKAERALDLIIVALIKSNQFLDIVDHKIGLTRFLNSDQYELYIAIQKYYQMNNSSSIDIEHFKKGYLKEESILDKFYDLEPFKRNHMHISTIKELEIHIKVVLDFEHILEIESLTHKIKKEKDEKKYKEYLEILQNLQRKKV